MAPAPPPIPKRPVVRELFGVELVDDYAWLRERDDPEVLAVVQAETARTEAILDARTGELRARLYAEMRARIKEDELSVPSKHGPWLYYARTEIGDEYDRNCRRPVAPGASPEQVYLDENELAAAHDYFELASLAISPDHRLCAFAFDASGDETYVIQILDLERGELLGDQLEGCGGSLAWADDQTLFYTRLDPAHRPWQAWRHRLGTPSEDDVLVHQEDDGKFYLGLARTRSDAYVVLSLDSQVSSEVFLIPTDAPESAPRLVAARQPEVEVGVVHHRDRAGAERLFVLTNEGATNFELRVVELDADGGLGPARVFLGHRDDVLIEDVDVFIGHLVVWERCAGLQRIRVVPLDPLPARAGDPSSPAPGEHLIAFPDPTYSIWSGSNLEFETQTLRFGYSSLTTPASVFDYGLDDRIRVLRKQVEVVGGHDPARFASARIWARAPDGEAIPISLVWLRDPAEGDDAQATRPSGARPLVLEGYGAYGMTLDPSFSRPRLSLLERGVVWALAHVRGGGELGRRWYESGKLEHKANSFSDFIACAEELIAAGWTTPAKLAATGGSAGGLLIGAVANARPELFRALVLDVPFVDVLNSMLDPDLPLSVVERDEWGDPNTAPGFAWIQAYSPYENVRAQAYPSMMVLAGFHDTRVGYWEALKWVARLRERKTDSNELLVWLNMDAGHAGASGRFEYLHEIALEYAFLIDQLGLPAAIE